MDIGSEKILLEQVRDGNGASFAPLVAAHSARIISLAFRLVGNQEDAEDLAQEAFLRLYRNLATFRGDSSVATWLYRTTTHLALDHLRRQKLKRKFFFFRSSNEGYDPVEFAADQGASPPEQFLANEAGKRLRQALEKLSVRQRMVFTLRHHEGMPLKEIGTTLGLEEGTVKAHLFRAVQVLRKELKELQGGLS